MLCQPMDSVFGLQPRVFLGAAASSTARTAIEMPFEYVKIQRQLAQTWTPSLKEAYRGFGLSWSRMMVALGGYFILMDIADRRYKHLFSNPVLGPFMQGSLCATAAWAAAWPLELLRTTAQAGLYPGVGAWERTQTIVRERGGALGLFRGIGPGLLRSLVANGAATLAYSTCRSCWPSSSSAA